MRSVVAILGLLLAMLLASSASAQTTQPARLPFQVDGPLTISPWVAAKQSNSPNKDHYIYSEPTPYYYGWYYYAPYPFYGHFWSYPYQSALIHLPR